MNKLSLIPDRQTLLAAVRRRKSRHDGQEAFETR